MKKSILFKSIFMFFSGIFIYTNINSFPQRMLICVPVADLRTKPIESPSNLNPLVLYKDNPFQDSQLLFGEKIIALEENKGFIKCKTIEQEKWNSETSTFEPKIGYIKSGQAIPINIFPRYNLVIKPIQKELWSFFITTEEEFIKFSVGTKLLGEKEKNSDWYKIFFFDENCKLIEIGRIHGLKINNVEELRKLSEDELRNEIVKTAEQFVDIPYSWGARSGYHPNFKFQSGIDCSSIVNLIYRINGIDIPRDAEDQFRYFKQISAKDLKAGDLIFSIRPDVPEKVTHVLMYLGNGEILESTGREPGLPPKFESLITNEIERFGKPIKEFENGEQSLTYGEKIFFGSIF